MSLGERRHHGDSAAGFGSPWTTPGHWHSGCSTSESGPCLAVTLTVTMSPTVPAGTGCYVTLWQAKAEGYAVPLSLPQVGGALRLGLAGPGAKGEAGLARLYRQSESGDGSESPLLIGSTSNTPQGWAQV